MKDQGVLSVSRLHFSYNRRKVLKGIDLEVHPGEVVCFPGPNGCGKTTLVKCLAGLLPPDSGHIRLYGRDVSKMNENQRAKLTSFVFQEHPAVFAYSVMDVVLMGRGPYIRYFASPSRKDRDMAASFLHRLGIGSLADRSFAALSGGEKQLVFIVRALVQEPAVLFPDEPTSFLDFGNQLKILDIINGLCRSDGRAVIMTTHEPDHAISVADRIILMKGGTVVDSGRPLDVLGSRNMEKLYGVRTRLVEVEDAGHAIYTVTPLGRRGRGNNGSDDMQVL